MIKNLTHSSQTRLIGLTLAISLLGLGGCERLKNYTDQEYLQKAKTAQSQGRLPEAVINLKNALQKNPNNAEARWLLGEAYVTLEQGREAEKELQRAQQLGINPESLKVPMGRALLLQGLYKRALDETQPGPDSSQGAIARMLEIQGQAQLGLGKLQGCLLFQQSQQKDVGYVPAYWGLARCALVKGKPDAARAELEKALKLEDKNSDTWALLGALERGNKRLTEAEAAYTRALQHKPNNLSALFGRAAVRLQNNKLKEAGQDLDASVKVTKNHPIGAHLRGALQFKNRNYADAKTSFETALRMSPDYMPAVLWLGLTNYALKNYEQAVQRFTQYTRSYPGAVQIQALLALAQAKLGVKQQAQETLKLLSSVDVEDPQSLMALGQAHFLIGESERATQYLQQAVARQPEAAEARVSLAVALTEQGENVQAVEQLQNAIQLNSDMPRVEELMIQTLVKDKKLDQALEAIEALKTKRPKDAQPYNYQGSVLYMKKDREGARLAFTKAIELQPGHPLASHNLAVLAVEDGKFDEARAIYRNVLKHNKDHLFTLLALYAMELKAKRPEQAALMLEEAVAKHPKEPGPAGLLALSYVNSRNPLKALEVSQEAARAHPDDVELLQVRGAAYATTGDTGNALTNYQRIVQLLPESAEAHFRLAAMHAVLNDGSAARKELEETLKRDPKHLKAKAALARINIAEGNPDEGLRLVKELQQEHPEAIEGAIIEAEALNRQSKQSEAVKVLELAHQRNPDSDKAMMALSRMRWALGDREGSLQLVKDWRDEHPNDPGPSRYLGLAYLSLGREQEATAAFEQALKLAPSDPIVLNNLAWLSGKTNPARALEYAEKAYQTAPKNPRVMDTLGWLLVQQGNSKRGLELLQKASELAPDLPVVRYHYAAALAKAGEKVLARRELERLLSSGKKFPEEPEARALLQQL